MSDSVHPTPVNNKLTSESVNSNKLYTSKQEEVINITNGYNMVLAGPGCGKTDILAERIARAYEKNNVSLSNMLCLTFTNRAARGMYERIKSRLGNDACFTATKRVKKSKLSSMHGKLWELSTPTTQRQYKKLYRPKMMVTAATTTYRDANTTAVL